VTLTPVEIRHVKLGRRPLGYDCRATEALLDRIAASFEEVWRERADLRDHVDRLETELAKMKELERILRDTLVSAERAAEEMRTQARREAELLVQEARIEAREVTSAAEDERAKIDTEIRRLRTLESEMRADYRAFLLTALDRIESDTEEHRAPGQAA
jgi:cell division initiation protein